MKIVDSSSLIQPEGLERFQKLQDEQSRKLQNEKLLKLTNIKNNNLTVKVTIQRIKINKNDEYLWILDFDGIRGVVTFQNSGLQFQNQMQQFVSEEIYVKITGIKKVNNNILVIANRKMVIEESELHLLENLELGQRLIGVVKGVSDNKIHVDISGGYILPIDRENATLSKKRISLKNYFHVGQLLNVTVSKIDPQSDSNKIEVVNSEVLEDPWNKNKFTKNDYVTGVISGIVRDKSGEKNHMIFALIEDELEALLIYNIDVEPKIGDIVVGKVTKYIPETKKFRVAVKKIRSPFESNWYTLDQKNNKEELSEEQ